MAFETHVKGPERQNRRIMRFLLPTALAVTLLTGSVEANTYQEIEGQVREQIEADRAKPMGGRLLKPGLPRARFQMS
jgi:hypothetical protein